MLEQFLSAQHWLVSNTSGPCLAVGAAVRYSNLNLTFNVTLFKRKKNIGAAFGISARGQNGETVFNHIAELDVPAPVKNAVKKAVQKTTKAATTAGKATQSGAGWVARKVEGAVKDEASKLRGELRQLGQVDIDSHLSADHRSAIMDFLRGSARKQQGKQQASDVPDLKGHSPYGASVSNGNINAAFQFLGGGAYLPTKGSTGVFLYVEDETKRISGFAASLKWELP